MGTVLHLLAIMIVAPMLFFAAMALFEFLGRSVEWLFVHLFLRHRLRHEAERKAVIAMAIERDRRARLALLEHETLAWRPVWAWAHRESCVGCRAQQIQDDALQAALDAEEQRAGVVPADNHGVTQGGPVEYALGGVITSGAGEDVDDVMAWGRVDPVRRLRY